MVYVIYDEYDSTIHAVTSTREKAEAAIEKLAHKALEDILAVDPSDSGIYWDDWSKVRRKEFYELHCRSSYGIQEMEIDGEVVNI